MFILLYILLLCYYIIGNKTLFISWHQLFPWFWMSKDLLDSFTFRMFHLAGVSYLRFQKRYFWGNENPSMTLAYDLPWWYGYAFFNFIYMFINILLALCVYERDASSKDDVMRFFERIFELYFEENYSFNWIEENTENFSRFREAFQRSAMKSPNTSSPPVSIN